MRLLLVLLLTSTVIAAPKLRDKPVDYRYIKPGLEFTTIDGYTVRVDHLYPIDGDGPDWSNRAYCVYTTNGRTVPYFTGDEYAMRPPTFAEVDALYHHRTKLKE